MRTVSVPFKITTVLHGLAEALGILRLEGENLVFEFQTKDSILGAIKSDVDRILIPITDIEEIEFRKGWFKRSLRMRLLKLDSASEIPGQEESGEINLSIQRRNAEAAFGFAASVNLEIAEARLRALDSSADDAVYLE